MSNTFAKLTVTVRTETGKGFNKKLRRSGFTPGIIYGHGIDPIPVAAKKTELIPIIDHPSIITLNIKEKGKKATDVLIKDVQYDYLSTDVIHVDFQKVMMDETITAKVRFDVIGEAIGTHHGGQLDQIFHELEVECLPGVLPEYLSCDVSHLEIGDGITIGQLTLPDGVTIPSVNPDVVVVHVMAQRLELEEETDEATEESGAEPAVISKGKKEEEE